MKKTETKYQNLMNSIILDIREGRLMPNDQLDTEEQLAEKFQVSRVTVRKAIDSLVKQGYVIRRQGKGTFVKDSVIRKQLNEVVSFYKSSLLRGEEPSTQLLELRQENPSPYIMRVLRMNEDDMVWFMRRLRLTNGFPMIYEESYWVKSIVGEIDAEVARVSMFQQLRNKITITYAHEDIDAIVADEKLSQILNVTVGFPLLRTTMVFYTEQDVPFEISVNYHRTDRLKLTLIRQLNE